MKKLQEVAQGLGFLKGSYQCKFFCKLGQGFLKGGVLGWMAPNCHLLGGALTRQEPSVDNAYAAKIVLRITIRANSERKRKFLAENRFSVRDL